MHVEAIGEAVLLQIHVASGEIDLGSQRDDVLAGAIERGAHQLAEPEQHVQRLLAAAAADQRGDRIERVEQEVRLNLQPERLELRPGELRLQLRVAKLQANGPPVRRQGGPGREQRHVDEQVDDEQRPELPDEGLPKAVGDRRHERLNPGGELRDDDDVRRDHEEADGHEARHVTRQAPALPAQPARPDGAPWARAGPRSPSPRAARRKFARQNVRGRASTGRSAPKSSAPQSPPPRRRAGGSSGSEADRRPDSCRSREPHVQPQRYGVSTPAASRPQRAGLRVRRNAAGRLRAGRYGVRRAGGKRDAASGGRVGRRNAVGARLATRCKAVVDSLLPPAARPPTRCKAVVVSSWRVHDALPAVEETDMKGKHRYWSYAAALLTLVAIAAWTIRALESAADCAARRSVLRGAPQAVMPQYDKTGALLLPEDYRRWVMIGASLGLSYSDGAGESRHVRAHADGADRVSSFRRDGNVPGRHDVRAPASGTRRQGAARPPRPVRERGSRCRDGGERQLPRPRRMGVLRLRRDGRRHSQHGFGASPRTAASAVTPSTPPATMSSSSSTRC